MKKLLCSVCLSLLLLFGLCSCTETESGRLVTTENTLYHSPNFKEICVHGYYYFVEDTDTNIMYIYCHFITKSDVADILTPYYNSKGVPMTYSEFERVHISKYHED